MLIRGYNNHGFEAWTIPTLYMVGKYLRLFAIKSDAERSKQSEVLPTGTAALMQDDFDPEANKQAQLRDCEQHLKRIFTLCLNDRAPLEESRKWGIYYIINLLFKTYFKLNSASLSRTILKTLAVYNQKGDMPPLESFPKSQRVTFKYYEGVLFFLEENYTEAEKYLVEAWNLCQKDAKFNSERILTYLIPCRLLTSHILPTKALLEPYPNLQELFLPLAKCIRSGDLRGFDVALQHGEDQFVKRRIYLTLERGRDIALRNLLRKVFLAGGFDEPKEGETTQVRRTRVPVAEFQAAICMGSGGDIIDTDEVECLLANMIYKVSFIINIASHGLLVFLPRHVWCGRVLQRRGRWRGNHVSKAATAPKNAPGQHMRTTLHDEVSEMELLFQNSPNVPDMSHLLTLFAARI